MGPNIKRGPCFTFLLACMALATLPIPRAACQVPTLGEIIRLEATPTTIDLLDPIPDLVSESGLTAITSNYDVLATKGTAREGVAADGVAKLVIRSNAPSPGTVMFSLADQNSQPLPRFAENGALTDLIGEQVNGTVSARTIQTSHGHQAYALYTAPPRFVRSSVAEDINTDERRVFIKVRFSSGRQTTDLPAVPIKIIRPPVMLVHGLWSDETAWSKFPLASSEDCEDSGRFFACRINYSNLSADHLVVGASAVGGVIRDKLDTFRSARRVAAVQSDVIAHSMGGLIVRALPLCGNASTVFKGCDVAYRTGNNLYQGDIHRLVTIGTPHLGSPLANRLFAYRLTRCDFTPRTLSFWFDYYKKLEIGGAIEDLQVGGSVVKALARSASAFPVHFVVGIASRNDEQLFNGSLLQTLRKCNSKIVLPDIRLALFRSDNDLLVPARSQRNGQSADAVGTTDSAPSLGNTIHSPKLTEGENGFSPPELEFDMLGKKVLQILDMGVFIGL